MTQDEPKKNGAFTKTGIVVTIILTMLIYLRLSSNIEVDCQCDYNITLNTTKNFIQAPHAQYNWNKLVNRIGDLGISPGLIVGSSMQPSIFEGNTLLQINMTQDYVLKAGEVVRYYVKNSPDCSINESETIVEEYVIHRIEAIYNDEHILVVGDNDDKREFIKRCQIKNVVVGLLFT